MSPPGPLARLGRSLAFARHVPPGRLARRLELSLRRAIRDRLGPVDEAGADAPALVAAPPQPLFAPRTGHVVMGADGPAFTFLSRTITMRGGVDWTAPGPGPHDQLWRMCLHYMEYLEEVDDAAFIALVESWIAANPSPRPGAWRDSYNSYALSIRVVVWMQQLARRAEGLPEDFSARVVASLAGQLRFLERNLETDIGGNHLVKNVKALIWASAFFTGRDAARWRATGLRLLAGLIAEQVLPDGMHDERSPSYHAQVFADLLECRLALGADPLGGALDAALARMAQAGADLVHPDGLVPLFNDAGLSMAYAPGECLAAYEALVGPAPTPRSVFAFPDAGYYGLRHGDTLFLADCGPIAPDALVAHAHGDVLSFEWSVGGRRMIVDQGVYEYVAGARRQAARAASSHNTLALDGADQADFFGAFRCGRRPRVSVLAYEARPDGFLLEGTHDGFAHLPGRPRHVRRFEARAERIVIEDRIEGRTARAASIAFLLHPDCAVQLAGSRASLRSGDAAATLDCSAPLALEPAVWWPDMGVERATHRLRATLPSGESRAVTTLSVVS